jgi:hypothetical protein
MATLPIVVSGGLIAEHDDDELRVVSEFDGLIFTIRDGPSTIVTAASAPRSFPGLQNGGS